MKALICGSIAYDTIMLFEDRFKNHILPEQVHILNVSFTVPQLRREFGGCATNIAYNLKLLGIDGLPMGTVGQDFAPYAEWLDRWGIDRSHVKELENTYTAQAYINTDLDDNQITAFHPGAMGYSHLNEIDGNGGLDLGMVSPDGRQGMIDHARQFAEANVPFIFDPGQGMTLFSGDELLEFVRGATWLTLNDYESQLLQQLTATSLSKLADKVEGMIVTLGGEGSRIYADGEIVEIPPATPNRVEDPTGCGDAYRAGLIYGVLNGLDWETTGRVASLMGAVKIEYHGTQNHTLTAEALEHRFQRSFGYSLADKVEEATFGREPV